jgi:hypothetical protein
MHPQKASWTSPAIVPWSACFPPLLGDESLWFRKKSIAGVALQLRRCSAPPPCASLLSFCAPASGAFYKSIFWVTDYETTKVFGKHRLDLFQSLHF